MADFFHERGTVRCMISIMRGARERRGGVFADVAASRDWLKSREDCTAKTGVIGFCMGGGLALLMAPDQKFDASSVNYGSTGSWFYSPEVLRGACPVVGSFGAKDKGLKALFVVMAKLGGMGYHEESASDARRRIASFFGEHLR
jgi:carboxymethylenebutenolidase